MSSTAIRILLVLAPLAVWMATVIPMEGVAVAGNTSSGRDVFLQNCALCHVNGLAMAPRVDRKADWEQRLAGGRSDLLKSVLRGKGGMPPKGGNASISNRQAEVALDYMLEKVAELDRDPNLAKRSNSSTAVNNN